MRILGIDTTTKFLCLGFYDDDRIYEYNLEVEKKLSTLLCPTIKRVLDALDYRIDDIDYFVCGLGPGSFTGMRVGLATIKGLSLSLNKPILGVSTLDILAKNTKETDSYIIPVIDAKRNLMYLSVYKIKKGTLKRIMSYMLLTQDEFFKISNRLKNNIVLLGDAIDLHRQNFLINIKNVTILDKDYWYPKAHHIIELAIERIKNKKFNDLYKLKPIYLYPKECQIRKSVTSKSVTRN